MDHYVWANVRIAGIIEELPIANALVATYYYLEGNAARLGRCSRTAIGLSAILNR